MHHTITELCHLRNLKYTSMTRNQIYSLYIQKKNLHCYDIDTIKTLKNLEQINIKTDELSFVDEFIKHIHLFENLYVFTVSLQIGNKYEYINLVSDNCYDTGNILFIKKLEKCSNIHPEDSILKCWNCYTKERLYNTDSKYCIIQNIIDVDLLDSMSCNVERLTILIGDNKFKLLNLPISLTKIIIVYNMVITPTQFYELHNNDIKVPFGCVLKIVRAYNHYEDDIDERILII